MVPSPEAMSLAQLRSERARLQRSEDAVSYARRIAQTRLDIVRARIGGLATGGTEAGAAVDGAPAAGDRLREVLSRQLLSPSGRPPRDTDAHHSQPSAELDELCAGHGFSRLDDLDHDGLARLAEALEGFERRLSVERRALFAEIDALSADLVRRYRDGSADVDELWDDGRGG